MPDAAAKVFTNEPNSIGAFLNALIAFLILAAVVYFCVVLPYTKAKERFFPGEAAGLFPPPSRWSGTTKQTMSYGYGISVTPLQMAVLTSALANGGDHVRTKGDVGHEVTVHDIYVKPVSASGFNCLNFIFEPAEICTKYRWGDFY